MTSRPLNLILSLIIVTPLLPHSPQPCGQAGATQSQSTGGLDAWHPDLIYSCFMHPRNGVFHGATEGHVLVKLCYQVIPLSKTCNPQVLCFS